MQYYESGYNAIPWTTKTQMLDSFYFEFTACKASFDFHQELATALATFKNWHFIFDNSLLANSVKSYFDEKRIICPKEKISIEPILKAHLERKFRITNEIDLTYIQICKNLNAPVLWPYASGRILNLNYRRVSDVELGLPYFVLIETERFHNLKMACQELGLEVAIDILKLTPTLFRSYLLHPYHLKMYSQKSWPLPHNDNVEREIWATLTNISELYPLTWNSGIANSNKVADVQVAHFPLHNLLRKYFNVTIEMNQSEAGLYGAPY